MFKKKESGEFINSVTVSSRGQQTFSGKDLMQILGALPAARVSPQSRRAAPDEMGAGGVRPRANEIRFVDAGI